MFCFGIPFFLFFFLFVLSGSLSVSAWGRGGGGRESRIWTKGFGLSFVQ